MALAPWFQIAGLLAVIAGVPAASQAAPAAVAANDRLEAKLLEFEAFVRSHMERNHVPGLTIGFVKDKRMWIRAFGLADIENKTPVIPESSFRLASVQKSMTAAAILQLAERGKLKLDDEVQRHVPYFPRKPYPITIRQLLEHSSGLPHYVDDAAEKHIKVEMTTRQSVDIFKDFALVSKPGEEFHYSTYGYVLLGAVIEGVSGQAYADYMRDNVWRPLGMNSTRMDDPLAIVPHRVRGYRLVEDGLSNSEFLNVSSRFAAGGTRGTVGDLLRFQQGLLAGKLVSRAGLATMTTPSRAGSRQPLKAGMSWTLLPMRDGRSAMLNDGGQPETRTFILSVPAAGFSLALAQNLESDNYAPIVFRLFEILAGEPFPALE